MTSIQNFHDNFFQPTNPDFHQNLARPKETQKSLKIPRFLEAPNPLPKPQTPPTSRYWQQNSKAIFS